MAASHCTMFLIDTVNDFVKTTDTTHDRILFLVKGKKNDILAPLTSGVQVVSLVEQFSCTTRYNNMSHLLVSCQEKTL